MVSTRTRPRACAAQSAVAAPGASTNDAHRVLASAERRRFQIPPPPSRMHVFSDHEASAPLTLPGAVRAPQGSQHSFRGIDANSPCAARLRWPTLKQAECVDWVLVARGSHSCETGGQHCHKQDRREFTVYSSGQLSTRPRPGAFQRRDRRDECRRRIPSRGSGRGGWSIMR